MSRDTLLPKMIEAYRRRKGLTRAELARRLGVARSTITRYETGARVPQCVFLVALEDILEVRRGLLCGRATR